ncbi:MAG: ArsA-related P-loop ATPase [Myxococcota bacterium]|nr:ArsA-related P-loop ATPase [Myxococcota bacterium]MEC8424981.1 ArsA-related P-loop ATPase [Myxococcota bacterium]
MAKRLAPHVLDHAHPLAGPRLAHRWVHPLHGGSVNVQEVLQSRLLLVTGKGGTGKTTLSATVGRLGAQRGRRTVVCEVDTFRPALTAVFGQAPDYEPTRVGPNLDICNVTWRDALVEWLGDTVPGKRIVKAILDNRVVQTFLEATPGLRETVILSKIVKLCDQYDQVVVDMPASGHAISLLGVPGVAMNLMRGGPIRERAVQIKSRLSRRDTALVIVALPEEMVVNETVELWERLHREVPELQLPLVALNRSAAPSLSGDEIALLDRLESDAALSDDPAARELLLAGRWEAGLEEATAQALERLRAELDVNVVHFSRLGALGGYEGGPQRIVQQLAAALARQELAEQQA